MAKKREPSPSRATRGKREREKGGESGSDWSNRSALVGQSADWVTRFRTARRLTLRDCTATVSWERMANVTESAPLTLLT